MKTHTRSIRVRVDGYTRVCLSVIAVLLTVMIMGLWVGHVPSPQSATAADQFLDTGADRKAMIEAQQETNKKLDELIGLLKSGEVKVKVESTGGKEDGAKK